MTNSLRNQRVPAIITGLALLFTTLGFFGQVRAQTVPPTFISLPDVSATASTSAGVAVNYALPVATSTSGSAVTVACTPPPGSVFSIGTTAVTCTATDSVGNTATGTFNVMVSLGSATSTPTVSILVNGSAGPTVTVSDGIPYTYTWTSTGATACQMTSPVISGVSLNSPTGGNTVSPGTTFFPTAGSPVTITISCSNGVTSGTGSIMVALASTTPVATTTPIVITSSSCTIGSSIVVSGTGPAGATMVITGGTATATTTSTGAGAFSATVGLSGATTTPLVITAYDPATGTVLSTTTMNAALGGGAAPTIALSGPNTVSMFVGNPYSDPGFTFTGATGSTATTTGFVNASSTGSYTLTYTVTDPCGRTASVSRTVDVVNATGGTGGNSSSGGSSSSGTGGVTGSVLPGSVNGFGYVPVVPYTPVPLTSPVGLSFLPALPNTGLGGDATKNIVSLLVAMAVSAVGLAVTLNSRKPRRNR